MANCVIASPNLIDSTYNTVRFSDGSWEASKPLSRIADPILIRAARTTSATKAAAQGQVDLGSLRGLLVTAIPKHNIRKRGKIFHRYSKVEMFESFATGSALTTGDNWVDASFEENEYHLFPYGMQFKFANHDTIYTVNYAGFQGQNYLWGGNDAEGWWTPENATLTNDQLAGPDGIEPATLMQYGQEMLSAFLLSEDSSRNRHYAENQVFTSQDGESLVHSIFVKRANRHKCRWAFPSVYLNTNYTFKSDELGDAAWTKTNVTVTINQLTMPDFGYATGDAIFETTANGVHHVEQLNSGLDTNFPLTLQVKVKANGRDRIRLSLIDNADTNNFVYAEFNLATESVTGTNDGGEGVVDPTYCTITELENGIYLITASGQVSTTAHNGIITRIQLLDASGNTSYVGDAAKGIYAGNIQLEWTGQDGYIDKPLGATAYIKNTTTTEVFDYGSSDAWIEFDMKEGEILSSGAVGALTLIDHGAYYVGDGWWRIWFAQSNTEQVFDYNRLYILDDDGNIDYQGEDGRGFYVWGPQCANGDQPDRFVYSDFSVWDETSLYAEFTPTLTADVPQGTMVIPIQGDYWGAEPTRVVDWEEVWKDAYQFGDLLFGDDSFFDLQVSDEDAVDYLYPYIDVAEAPFIGRFWQFKIDNTTNPDGYIELNRVYIAPGWQPSLNLSYGAGIGWVTDAQIVESLGGVEFIHESSKGREIRGTLDNLPEDEGLQYPFEIDRRSGLSKQVMFIFNPDDTIHLHRRSFLGRFKLLSQLEFPVFSRTSKGVEIKEVRG